MKTTSIIAIFSLIFLTSCKTEPKTSKEEVESMPEKTIPEKIADAHGFENWRSIAHLKFTFNVDRDSTHFERSWIWKPKLNEVTAISGADSLTYNTKSMDSIAYKRNAGFINDRYWLVAPFNLMWDSTSYTFDHNENETAPISGETMQKLTVVYDNEGGYTPGDAYDFYFKEDYLLREWVYRKSNQKEPSLATTWENYIDPSGLKIALDHKKGDGSFHLYFTEVSVME